jgi:hypothetical protein
MPAEIHAPQIEDHITREFMLQISFCQVGLLIRDGATPVVETIFHGIGIIHERMIYAEWEIMYNKSIGSSLKKISYHPAGRIK